MPKKGDLSGIMYLEIEKSRINREKSRIVLNKSLSLYIVFMIVGVIGFVFDFIDSTMLNTLIIAGIVILVLGTLPYLLISHKEEKKIDDFIKKLKK
ncbi:hypothetical protein KY361_04495 [Candidatus Woesearchaeota archaeon]|nr:hypothetical protein [Candidatus Woesearchaeota archaeon]